MKILPTRPSNDPRSPFLVLLIIASALGISSCAGADDRSQIVESPVDQANPVIAITDITVIDGLGGTPAPHLTVFIRDGHIEAIGSSSSISFPDSTRIINGAGKFLIPGLIDTHVHLATDPTSTDNRETVEAMLAQALNRGITSVRDMAGDTRALADLKRDALVFDIHSPNIYFSALMSGPVFFADPRTQKSAAGLIAGETPWMRAVTPDIDLRIAIAEAKGTGATGIKIYANLPADAVSRIVAEAHKQDMKVWSHGTIGPAGPADVLRAGVDVLSHIGHLRWAAEDSTDTMRRDRAHRNADSTFWDLPVEDPRISDFLGQIAESDMILDATLSVYANAPEVRMTALNLQWIYEVTRAAHSAGIPVSTGTDVDGEIATLNEIALFVEKAGFSPLEAITAATIHGARAIGIDDGNGSIQSGKVADLVVLNSNPAENIENLRDIAVVIKTGWVVVYRNR